MFKETLLFLCLLVPLCLRGQSPKNVLSTVKPYASFLLYTNEYSGFHVGSIVSNKYNDIACRLGVTGSRSFDEDDLQFGVELSFALIDSIKGKRSTQMYRELGFHHDGILRTNSELVRSFNIVFGAGPTIGFGRLKQSIVFESVIRIPVENGRTDIGNRFVGVIKLLIDF